jgi:FAD/FMN-containing dehydrogenase
MLDLSVNTLEGQTITLASSQFAGLRKMLNGRLLLPDAPGYDDARKIWNGMIDKRPALIARCQTAAEVAACVNLAREHRLLVSVRGGGHSLPGHSVCNGGLMIDLSPMKNIQVDTQKRTARAGAGLLWRDFDAATHEHGLAVTGGQISHTGIAGLTLGGGIGWLMRKFGLTCDNLISAEIVTADGKIRQISATAEPELFWGIRGGGGNFGVVTTFEYRLHPLKFVFGGLVAFPLPEAPKVLAALRDYSTSTPDELTVMPAFITSPDGHPAVGIAFCFAGEPQQGEAHLVKFRTFGTVVMEQTGAMPYPVVQQMLDHVAEPQRRYYLKSNMLDSLSDDAIQVCMEHYLRVPSPLCAIIIPQMGGAISRVKPDATAFPHRNAAYSFSAFAVWTDPKNDAANKLWAQKVWEALRPYAPNAVYVNEMVDEGEERVREAYGEKTYARLAQIKRKYDPDNLFRLNQNIKPAV